MAMVRSALSTLGSKHELIQHETSVEERATTSHADIVVGSRSREHGLVSELPFFKRVVSGSTNWVLRNAFRIPCSDVTSGFRLYSAKSIEVIRDRLVSRNFEITAEILIRAKKQGYSITEVPITFTRRPRGKSKLSFIKSGIGYGVLLDRKSTRLNSSH